LGHLWLFFNCNYRFLDTGDSYRSLAFQFRIHHSWISVIVRQTVNVICERLQKVAIPEPNEETLKQTADGYNRRWHFPHCCGSIDGKRIRIICRGKSGSRYFNYKGFYSIVMLSLVQLMSVLMEQREMLGYLPSHLLGINFQKLLNSRHQDLFQEHRQFYLT